MAWTPSTPGPAGPSRPAGTDPRRPQTPRPAPPTLAVPDRKPGRSYGETFGSSSFLGEVTLTLPLPVNVARLVPDLSLAYAASGANGPFGLGLSLSIGTIARRTDAGIPRYDDTDTFLGPDGQELTPGFVPDGRGGWIPDLRSATEDGVTYAVRRFPPRVEDRSIRIEQWSGSDGQMFWRVRDGDDTLITFGKSPLARIADPADPWRIASWLPEETTDRFGNRLLYVYKPEDNVGWSGVSFPAPAQRYLAEVRYGNYLPAGAAAESFAFSLVFDYGEYAPLTGNPDPVRPWPARSDPQTSFRTGFPLQTLRLCASVFSVNRIPEAAVGGPLVDEVLSLTYDDPSSNKLVQAQLTGQRRATDGSLQAASLPALTLDYTPFEPEEATWQRLTIAGTADLPTAPGGTLLNFADLHGEGLPGLVLSVDATMSYAPPLGGGRYGAVEPLPVFPNAADVPSFALRDLDGNGHLSLTANTPDYGGFFLNRNDGGWDGFRTFPSYTAEAASPASTWVDLDGNGLADLLVPAGDQTRAYLSRGTLGFAPPLTLVPTAATRDLETAGAPVLSTYADMFGDGLEHRVVVRSGRIDVWPNLGYGKFGARISWPNAPSFGELIGADRIILGSVLGGSADLLLVYPDHGLLYLNPGVAGFGEPIRIDFPSTVGPTTTVAIVDLLGHGQGCIVVSQQNVFAASWYLDLCDDGFPDLLAEADNGIGGETSIAYRSSTDFYLADRARGVPWLTRLAFPVVVVERLDHVDGVTALVNTEQHQYRDGYYDPVERRFRGFGFVQSINARAIDDGLWSFPSPHNSAEPIGGPAQLTKQWSYTGSFVSPDAEVAAYSSGFFTGAGLVPAVGGSVLAPPLRDGSADTVREATAALAGSPIRTEIWSVADDGSLDAAPLQVEENSQTVTELQPHIGDAWSSVMLTPRESVTLHYDGIASDPRIEQDATLAWDDYGQPTRSTAVFYPRPQPAVPAQGEMRITVTHDGLSNQDTADIFLIGIPYETTEYEAAGVVPDAGRYFSYDGLAAAIAAALAQPIDYGEPFGTGPQARPFFWGREYYWNAAGDAVLPLGSCGPRALLHHSLDAVFPPSFVATAYGGLVDDAMLTEAGLASEAGMWWSPSDTVSYAGVGGYFQPIGFQTVFQTAAAHTTLGYDPYQLFVTRSTDALGFSVTSAPDYQALEPWAVTDVNGMVTQGLYSPLKRLTVISQHAIVAGKWQGGMDLANYQPHPVPDLATLAADPMTYLQGARGFYLPGYPAAGQPAFLATVAAMADCDAPSWNGHATAEPGINVGYLDGFGRSLEALQRVEAAAVPGTATRGWTWRSVTRVDYDHGDRVLRTYVPAFQQTYAFQPADTRAFTAFQYDALDRQIRIDTAKGFILATHYPDAWTVENWDADDTVLQSPYYQTHINDPDLPPQQRRALQQAARFADTPTSDRLDPQGQTVRIDAINVDARNVRSILQTTLTVDVRGLTAAAVDPRLSTTPGLHNMVALYDMQDRPVRVTRADSGTELLLRDALGETLHHWTALGAHIETVYETLIRRPKRRLVTLKGATSAIEVARFAYGSDPATQSVNRLVLQHDQAGIEATLAYDIDGRETSATRQFAQSAVTPVDWTATVPLQASIWPTGWRYDPAGRLLEQTCSDGSAITRSYFANGWLDHVTVTPAGATVPSMIEDSLRYEAGGGPVTARYGDGMSLAWSYDPLTGELIAATATRISDGARLQDLAYFYDPQANVSSVVDNAAATLMGGLAQPLIKDYTFDAIYRLTNATGFEAAQASPPWQAYTQTLGYDPGNNLVAVAGSAATVALTVSATSNHAVATSMLDHGGTVDGFFDAAGNLLSLADGTALAYDFENRLTAVTLAAAPQPNVRYCYGQDGLRLRKAGADADIYHLGAAYIEAKGSSVRTSLLVPGAFGDTLFVTVDGTRLAPSYLITDRLSSVTLELGSNADMQRYQDYYPYGPLSVSLAPAPPDLPARLGFAGKEHDGETSLSYFGGRYYVPSWGRWLTADPLGEVDGLNLYEYCNSNPVSHSDPTGLAVGKNRRIKRRRPSRRVARKSAAAFDFKIKSTVSYGTSAKFGTKGYGGTVLTVTGGKGSGVFSFWVPRSSNTGKGVSRQYPITSVGYRQNIKHAVLRRRLQRSMFRFKDKTQIGYVRGHQIPHADTVVSSPLSGGLISTRDKINYYPEPEGWGEQQRKHREGKARGRETPLVQYNEYSANPAKTNDGTPVPDRIYFIELTGWSTNKAYASSKSYNIKSYKVEYSTFDYDSLPKKNGSDRRALSSLRVFSLPPGAEAVVRQTTGYATPFKF